MSKMHRGVVGGAGIMIAASQGQQSLENLRYGEISSAMLNASITAGAGYLGYGALSGNARYAAQMTSFANKMRGHAYPGGNKSNNLFAKLGMEAGRILQKSIVKP